MSDILDTSTPYTLAYKVKRPWCHGIIHRFRIYASETGIETDEQFQKRFSTKVIEDF